MHIDPLFTDAFNALIKGKKWWVIIPRDLYEFPEHFTCLKTCSGESDSTNFFYDVKLWYSHMLPQLRLGDTEMKLKYYRITCKN